MKTSLVLFSSWVASDPRRSKLMLTSAAVFLMLLGLSAGGEAVLAGRATGGVH